MPRTTLPFIAALMSIAMLTACTESSVDVPPDPCSPMPCDTCDNYYPPPPGVQADGAVPFVCWSYRGRISPDRRYIVYETGNQDYVTYRERNFPIVGLLVLEIATNRTVLFLSGFFNDWLWAPDSRTVYFLRAGMQPVSSVSIETEEIKSWPELGRFEKMYLAANARIMYLKGVPPGGSKAGIVRWDLQTGASDFITDAPEIKFNGAMVLNDSVLCGLGRNDQKVYFLNVHTKQLQSVHVPDLRLWSGVGEADPSPDGKRILFQTAGPISTGDGYVSDGVWLLELETLQARQVLPRHSYYNYLRERPVWSGNNTFVASWFCRKDSTELLYEYNLAGKPIRQLNTRYTKYWVEK
jgi:hypothetical protein